MKKTILLLLLIILYTIKVYSQKEVFEYFHGQMPETNYNNQLGGYVLPSEGTLKILIIFAQFPDDNYDTQNSAWVKGQFPVNMQNWLDETWTSNPTPWSLTDYFNQMSLGRLRVIGKEASVITPHTREWYLQNSKNRYDIHKEIIQQLDQTLDFAQFDNWTKTWNSSTQWYVHSNVPDGKVEFICIVWRNIAMEYNPTDRNIIMTNLNMGWYGSLAYGSNYNVDGGQRTIVMSDTGSGATIADYFYKDAFRFTIHEFAHYLLGGNEFHNGHGFWAMLSGYEVRSYMINAYERYRLGWCNLITVSNSTQTLMNATLPDFITTGIAYRIDIDPASNQFFFIENHQKISRWDNCSKSDYPDDKGLFVIRQDRNSSQSGSAADWMWLVPAEGRYNWEAARWEPNWWGSGYLPVFRKLDANRETGYSPTDFIPLYNPYIGQTQKYEIVFCEGANGQLVLDPLRQGKGKDAFRLGYNEVFSLWSNPNSQKANRSSTGIGFKINSVNSGVYNIDIYVNTAINAPPSIPQDFSISVYNTGDNAHPKLNWELNIEPDVINSSQAYLIERSINGGAFTQIATVNGSTSQYIDYGVSWVGGGPNTASYKIRVKDTQGLTSLFTDVKSISYGWAWKIGTDNEEVITEYNLYQNYPNPFNPITNIVYQIPKSGFVQLKVFDILGKEVAVLVNEVKPEGSYSVIFDASDLPSGIYIYSLRVNDFIQNNKMTLLK